MPMAESSLARLSAFSGFCVRKGEVFVCVLLRCWGAVGSMA